MRAAAARLVARARSARHLTTESSSSSAAAAAAAESASAAKPARPVASRGDRLVKEMTPVATFLGIVATVGAIGAYYSSRLSALEERMTGTASKLEERMTGTASKLEERVAGTAAALKSDMAGTAAALKSDMAGLRETIDASTKGTTSKLEERVAGIEKAADLKVRPPYERAAPQHSYVSHTPSPLARSTRPSDGHLLSDAGSSMGDAEPALSRSGAGEAAAAPAASHCSLLSHCQWLHVCAAAGRSPMQSVRVVASSVWGFASPSRWTCRRLSARGEGRGRSSGGHEREQPRSGWRRGRVAACDASSTAPLCSTGYGGAHPAVLDAHPAGARALARGDAQPREAALALAVEALAAGRSACGTRASPTLTHLPAHLCGSN